MSKTYQLHTGKYVWLTDNNFYKILKDKDRKIDKLNEKIIDVENDLVEKNDENKRLKKEKEKFENEKEKLENEIERLKRELNILSKSINRSSSNSNWSSSTNRPWVKNKKHIYSSRIKSDLKVGGQVGHEGHFGKLCLNPDKIVTHLNEQPPRNGFVDLPNNKIITQVKEIQFKTEIIQHEYTFDDGTNVCKFATLPNAHTYGNSVKSLIIWMTNRGFVAVNRITDFMKELSNGEIEITNGYTTNLMLDYAKKLETINQQLQKDVKNTNILHFDETCVKLNGKLVTIQGYANDNTTYLTPTIKKCDTKIQTFLEDYQNWLVVDYCKSYQKLEKHCKIVGCNAHIDRYLRRMIIDYKIPEAKQMQDLLKQLQHKKQPVNFTKVKNKFIGICQSFLNRHQAMNNNDKFYYNDAYLLFKRLKEKWHQHLAFVNNDVPYTNNLIERDFRHAKTKMKISGSFRSWNHLIAFTLIHSFLKTCNKRHLNLWTAINRVWANQFSF